MSASGRSREGRQHADATKEFADMNRTLMSSPIHRGPITGVSGMRRLGNDMFEAINTRSAAVIGYSQPAAESASPVSPARALHAIAIETKNLCRTLAGKMLVNGVSVQIQKGEVLAVIGPSGAGKSSFLRLLNRLDEPTAGTVLFNNGDYRDVAPQDLRRRVGMVMQTAYLFPGTVAANVAFGPRQRHETLSPDQIAALLERVGLPGYENRDVSNLSGGESQRVSLARTLANVPEALLLDEPTSALDDASARAIEELLLSIIRERKMTCVIVTHNRFQADRIADRTMYLDAGKLIAIGPTKEILHAH